jgi:hypothetical protein
MVNAQADLAINRHNRSAIKTRIRYFMIFHWARGSYGHFLRVPETK